MRAVSAHKELEAGSVKLFPMTNSVSCEPMMGKLTREGISIGEVFTAKGVNPTTGKPATISYQCVFAAKFIKVEGKGPTNASAAENVFSPFWYCLLYTSPSPRDQRGTRMPSSA